MHRLTWICAVCICCNGPFPRLQFIWAVLQKHAYSNIMKFLPPKKWKFLDRNSDTFHISAVTINCVYSLELPWWGSSKEYPQSMFLSRDKKNNVYPCKSQFYYIKVEFKGSQNYIGMFSWWAPCVSMPLKHTLTDQSAYLGSLHIWAGPLI